MKQMMTTKTKMIFLMAAMAFAACSKTTDTDKVGDAQLCLNKAAGATAVNECLTKVDGLETTGAYGVRCNGAFIREGFASPTKYTNAFSALQGGGSTQTMDFMGLIMFSSATTITENNTNASSTFNYCYSSGAKGTTLIAALGSVATSMYNYMNTKDSGTCSGSCATAPSGNPALYSLTTCSTCFFGNASNLLPTIPTSAIGRMLDPTTSDTSATSFQASIGSTIVSTYSISCASSSSNQQLCSTLSTAITAAGGATNTRKVATKLMCTIANVNPSYCP